MQTAAPAFSATPSTSSTAPYRLIGAFQDHLKFMGRAPASLAEKLQARADWEYARRTAELKKMSSRLALLEPLLPALAALGTPVHDRDFHLWTASQQPAALRITPSFFGPTDDKLHTALLTLGFREVERAAYGGTTGVTLKHGRALYVRITVQTAAEAPPPAAPQAAAAPVAATAQGVAA